MNYFFTDELQHTVLLYPDECPLARAISNKKVPRFVLRSKDENSNTVEINETPTKKEKRKKLFSFHRHSEEKPEKEKKQKPSKGKKGKIDKSAISVEINHFEEKIDDSHFSSEGEIEPSATQDLSPFENDDSLTFKNNSEIEPSEDIDSSNQVINLDSDPEDPQPLVINGETFIEDSSKIEDTEIFEAEADENHQSVDPEEETDTVSPLADPSSVELKRKLSFSNSSVFFEQDNDPPVLEKRKASKKKEKTDKKKKPKGSSRTKSFSMMVRGNKKKGVDSDPSALTELSTYKLAPGILKVFGDHLNKTSNYKAVRASTISTSQEVVRMALERYGLEDCNPKDYVLCDVVGHFSNSESSTPSKKKGSKKEKHDENEDEEPKWITEYVRAINDNEKPLVLQSLWKPTNGRSRRFELRKRVEVESSCFFINTADGMGRSSSQTSLFDDSEHSSIANDNSERSTEYAPVQMSPHTNSRKITQRQDSANANRAPQYSPYLLLINGSNPHKDELIHKLEDPTIVVGAYVDTEIKQCDVALYSSDILLPHCWIYKKVKLEQDSTETNLDEINFLVFIEPANGADITVNGAPVVSTTQLKPGHLVSFGQDYLFIFKDPTQPEVNRENLAWWSSLSSGSTGNSTEGHVYSKITRNTGIQVEMLRDDESDEHTEDSEDEEESSHGHSAKQTNLAARKKVEKSALGLTYVIKDEEELLHSIIEIADQDIGGNIFISKCIRIPIIFFF